MNLVVIRSPSKKALTAHQVLKDIDTTNLTSADVIATLEIGLSDFELQDKKRKQIAKAAAEDLGPSM